MNLVKFAAAQTLILLLACTAANAAEEVLFSSNFNDESQANIYGSKATYEKGRDGNCISVSSKGESTYIAINIPAEKAAGKMLELSALVKADAVSEKKKDWNGIKVQLYVETADGEKSYPQASIPAGTFDWQEFSVVKKMPANLKAARIVIGLEDVSGKVYFDNLNLKITE